ncbi:MAG: hypothetical protein KIT83_21910, partial [Bryobacterales bacterium]|nr:hypothetical protein [Bryobacterales bacterium]
GHADLLCRRAIVTTLRAQEFVSQNAPASAPTAPPQTSTQTAERESEIQHVTNTVPEEFVSQNAASNLTIDPTRGVQHDCRR